MGADLITYMYVGPKNINKNEDIIHTYYEANKEFLSESELPFDSFDDFKSFCIKFIDFWNSPSSRDSNSRFYKDMKIVIAGDTTWGDTPDGVGYELFDIVARNDLEDLFDLE